MIYLPRLTVLAFVMAFGACAGSLINVLVYRLPRGLDVVRPQSRCPSCGTKLTWRENVPVLGWVLLGGRCRFCRTRISPEYPVVEAAVAVLFGVFFVLWYMLPPDAVWLGVPVGRVAPEWADNGPQTWPAFVVVLFLAGSLVAMLLVDAKTFTIPLVLTWVPALVGLALHVGHAAWFEARYGGPEDWLPSGGFRSSGGQRYLAAPGPAQPSEVWALATPGVRGWWWIGLGIGGVVGLGVSNLLLAAGLIRRSFADYEAWERDELERRERAGQDGAGQKGADAPGERGSAGVDSPADLWIQYPHARREMVREMAFLSPVVVLALVGGWLGERLGGPWAFDPVALEVIPAREAPLWLTVLGGVLVGYLVGGGVVWLVRLAGSLAFGKEAMGLGDVHMMAAVGACLGWIDPTLAFFGAAFLGVGWAVLGRVFGGGLARAMPYGPFLALATLLVLLCKPGLEAGLSLILRAPVNIP